jgi:hypothetical protein
LRRRQQQRFELDLVGCVQLDAQGRQWFLVPAILEKRRIDVAGESAVSLSTRCTNVLSAMCRPPKMPRTIWAESKMLTPVYSSSKPAFLVAPAAFWTAGGW